MKRCLKKAAFYIGGQHNMPSSERKVAAIAVGRSLLAIQV